MRDGIRDVEVARSMEVRGVEVIRNREAIRGVEVVRNGEVVGNGEGVRGVEVVGNGETARDGEAVGDGFSGISGISGISNGDRVGMICVVQGWLGGCVICGWWQFPNLVIANIPIAIDIHSFVGIGLEESVQSVLEILVGDVVDERVDQV